MAVLFHREPPGRPAASLAFGPGALSSAASSRPGSETAIRQIIEQRLVSAEYQPLVELDTGRTWGYEALARGPASSPLSTPWAMFDAATHVGLAGDLDIVAHAAAVSTVLHNTQGYDLPLSVNSGPVGLMTEVPDDLAEVMWEAMSKLTLIVEVSENALVGDPLGTMVAIAHARASGLRIAIDNVGVSLSGLPILPLVQPDMIKLDMSLVADGTGTAAARIIDGLSGYTERADVMMVAQGIEREEQKRLAYAMGATLGQGYFFSRPLVLPKSSGDTAGAREWATSFQKPVSEAIPYEVLSADHHASVADPGVVKQLAMLIEQRVESDPDPSVVIVVSPDGRFPSGVPMAQLRNQLKKASLVLVLTPDTNARPAQGMRVHHLDAKDPLAGESTIAVIGLRSAIMLTSRPIENDEEGGVRYLLSHDRDVVARASRALIERCVESLLSEKQRQASPGR